MRILFINNDGAGFADHIEIEEGLCVEQLFQQRLPHGKPQDYLIRVNRQPTSADYVLQSGDRVSITPLKIEGAVDGKAKSSSNFIWKEQVWESDNGSILCIYS